MFILVHGVPPGDYVYEFKKWDKTVNTICIMYGTFILHE